MCDPAVKLSCLLKYWSPTKLVQGMNSLFDFHDCIGALCSLMPPCRKMAKIHLTVSTRATSHESFASDRCEFREIEKNDGKFKENSFTGVLVSLSQESRHFLCHSLSVKNSLA